jgi:hypothetical protein
MSRRQILSMAFATITACALVACAQLPKAVAELGWQDLRGDRGAGVLARDYAMCSELVEQRRGLLKGCMEARGWSTGKSD